MDRLLNISDRTAAALHALVLAARTGTPVTAASAAAHLGVSASYLAKVLQPLARAGILESTRGARGGFVLARDPAAVTALDVLELLDGGLPGRDCLFETRACGGGPCPLRTLTESVTESTRRVLGRTTVAALAARFREPGRRRRVRR